MTPPDLSILIAVAGAALIGGTLGFVTASIYYAARAHRAEREGWKSAVRFYQARKKQDAREARL